MNLVLDLWGGIFGSFNVPRRREAGECLQYKHKIIGRLVDFKRNLESKWIESGAKGGLGVGEYQCLPFLGCLIVCGGG